MVGFLVTGCFTPPEAILETDYAGWTARDCMTIIASNMRNNYHRNVNVYASVLPYSPDVARALARLEQLKNKLTDSEATRLVNALLKDGSGLYRDEQGELWNPTQGRYQDSRSIDSLLFSLELMNWTWPCRPLTLDGQPVMLMSDVPCETPDISDIENRIMLVNDSGQMLRPKFVSGRVSSMLMENERLWVGFDFTQNRDFLKSGKFEIKILGFSNDMDFEFVIEQSDIRFATK